MRKERLKKAAFARKFRIFAGSLLILVITGILIFWSGRQLYFFCLARAIKTTPAKMGNLSIAYPAAGIILRSETVIKSPGPGKLIQLIPEGERVRAGNVVARLESLHVLQGSPGFVELRSPQAGFVCYHIDGWEGVLTPGNWERLDLSLLFKDFQVNWIQNTYQTVTGEPVFKIIDNLINPVLILKIEEVQPLTLNVEDKVDLKWEAAQKGRGKVLAVKRLPEGLVASVELLETNFDLPCSRTLQLQMINQKYEGVIVPARSLTRTGQGVGVITSSPVGFKFQKVEIVGRLGDQVAVRGISPGSEIVLNTNLVKRLKKKI
ncbi:MAG: HlyD family efflux transporter periplasmic adaptor subunit [Bacillota bacterium]|nr:HlyD family efflux transporter periplasmic adaptor subunit [Bacillota bacterium]